MNKGRSGEGGKCRESERRIKRGRKDRGEYIRKEDMSGGREKCTEE